MPARIDDHVAVVCHADYAEFVVLVGVIFSLFDLTFGPLLIAETESLLQVKGLAVLDHSSFEWADYHPCSHGRHRLELKVVQRMERRRRVTNWLDNNLDHQRKVIERASLPWLQAIHRVRINVVNRERAGWARFDLEFDVASLLLLVLVGFLKNLSQLFLTEIKRVCECLLVETGFGDELRIFLLHHLAHREMHTYLAHLVLVDLWVKNLTVDKCVKLEHKQWICRSALLPILLLLNEVDCLRIDVRHILKPLQRLLLLLFLIEESLVPLLRSHTAIVIE